MSMMSFTDLLRRKERIPEETFGPPVDPPFPSDAAPTEATDPAAVHLDAEAPKHVSDTDARPNPLTQTAQSRMASFKIVEEANRDARDELVAIGRALSTVASSYHLGRDFLDECRDEIVRTSELEHAKAKLQAENRRLLERGEKQELLRQKQEDVIEGLRRRESRLMQDEEMLREELGAVRMEMTELRNATAGWENVRSELHVVLASRNAELERATREVEISHERATALTSDVEAAQKRSLEMRRRFEEMQEIHAKDGTRLAEVSAKLEASEKDIARWQKQIADTEAQLQDARYQLKHQAKESVESERGLRSEVRTLRNELEQATRRLQVFVIGSGEKAPRPDIANGRQPFAATSFRPAANGAEIRQVDTPRVRNGRRQPLVTTPA